MRIDGLGSYEVTLCESENLFLRKSYKGFPSTWSNLYQIFGAIGIC